MIYHLSKFLLLRQPVKSPRDITNNEQLFLNEDHFRAAILLASPLFFEKLRKRGFILKDLSEKEKLTVKKYINRYCYRPTPFGLFSSVSLIEWGDSDSIFTKSETVLNYKILLDQSFQTIIISGLSEKQLFPDSLYEPNPSIYRALKEYRFFSITMDEQLGQRDYLLQSVAYAKLLKDLIQRCRAGYNRQQIESYIIKSADCEPEEAAEYTSFLIDSQFLVNSQRASISGKDYLESLKQEGSPLSPLLTKVINVIAQIKGPIKSQLPNTAAILKFNKAMKELGISCSVHLPPLNVLSYQLEGQTISLARQNQLQDALFALNILAPHEQPATLAQFIKAFKIRFEGQRLPLLQILDPEIGIGYQHPLKEKHNPLLETIHIPQTVQKEPNIHWSAASTYLLQSWLNSPNFKKEGIQLNEKDLQKISPADLSGEHLGLAVLFREIDGKLFIESAGGNNAVAMMGRFTLANEHIRKAAVEMAQQLENLNPHILFAELLHLTDTNVDNVNRREHIYHMELPITAASVLPTTRQLELADLSVYIENDKVILFSEKHRKKVIPRLSSAYNHSLNKLPLFRFLADLPYQYGRTNLSFDLRSYFPGLQFYPRVGFKDTILCLATWVIPAKNLAGMLQEGPTAAAKLFASFSEELGLPEYFSIAENDQQLVFCKHKETDIPFFIDCCRNKNVVILKEFLEQPEVRQYNAFLLPTHPINFDGKHRDQYIKTTLLRTKRKFIPGSEWLYLKIYTPKIGTNRLLLKLRPLLSRTYKSGKISQWFFIRYEDAAPHIRLRLKVSTEDISDVLQAFKIKLEERIEQHVIREYKIDIYSRELERYAAVGIEKSECIFWASSELVMYFISSHRHLPLKDTHHFALISTIAILNIFFPEPEAQINMTRHSYELFLNEFSGATIKPELDKKYRELRPSIEGIFNKKDRSLLSGSIKAGIAFVKMLRLAASGLLVDNESKKAYVQSIIHMHLNRVFPDDARKQEMITYYLLHKHLNSEFARKKRLVNSD